MEKEKELALVKAQKDDKDEKFLNNLLSIKDKILEGIRLDNDTYTRLCRDTIERITVYPLYIEIALKDGNSFRLERKIGKHKAKSLPIPEIQLGNNLKWIISYCSGKEETLIDNDKYTINTK